ncbi:autorepressor SdpR family transcription factor [Leptobacterium sp. I13]|uniref:autorepressor SdpR family transcription factor n=1 Tax=Leptobacterium meishanense TaxID=3128904 RepID=UPI0030EBEBA9
MEGIFVFLVFKNLFRYLSKYLNIVTPFFKALNDTTRRKILELLKEKDLTAGEIAEEFAMTKPSISHHLEILKNASLVSFEKKGQFIIYSLNTSILDEILQWVINLKSDT